MRFPLACSLALVALSGCDCNPVFVVVPPPTDQVDVFTQKAAAQVDILWVMDNSPSMVSEQNKVAARFNEFFHELVTSKVEYHIGIVTTDISEKGVLHAYNGPSVDGCDACRFVTNQIPCAHPDVDLTGLSNDQIDATLAANCPAQLVFRKLILVGTGGGSFEQGFVQAGLALGANTIDPATGFPDHKVPAANAGFLRDDAALYIVFTSDEDEGAKRDGTPVRYYQRLFEGLKKAGNENKVTVAGIVGYPTTNDLPPLDQVCAILQTTFDSDPTNDDPRAAAVKDALLHSERGCTDSAAAANDPNSSVETGGRYIELACRTGGVFANMCDADYNVALDSLGVNAAGLQRRFALSRPKDIDSGSDCQLFTADDTLLDCNGDKQTNGPLDGTICVTARPLGSAPGTEALVPRDDLNGWHYEASTSSIRFDGKYLPAPGTNVTIRYRVRAAGDNQCQ